jgi:hypothetical protein
VRRERSRCGLVASRWAADERKGSGVPTGFADHQREAMLRAIREREGRWDEVDPDTEVARIGENIGLDEDQSYELFGHLVDEGFVDPGGAYGSGARCRAASAGSSDVKRT